MIAPYTDIFSALFYEEPLSLLIVQYICNDKAACDVLLQQNKHLAVISACCGLLASDETSYGQKGMQLFRSLITNCKDHVD